MYLGGGWPPVVVSLSLPIDLCDVQGVCVQVSTAKSMLANVLHVTFCVGYLQKKGAEIHAGQCMKPDRQMDPYLTSDRQHTSLSQLSNNSLPQHVFFLSF